MRSKRKSSKASKQDLREKDLDLVMEDGSIVNLLDLLALASESKLNARKKVA